MKYWRERQARINARKAGSHFLHNVYTKIENAAAVRRQHTTKMEPISRAILQSRHNDSIEDAKRHIRKGLVSRIRQRVEDTAMKGEEESRVVHLITPFVGDAGCVHPTLMDVRIKFEDIQTELLDDLRAMFPDCKISYVTRRPETDSFDGIFGARPHVIRKTRDHYNNDCIDRAIVIDWSS